MSVEDLEALLLLQERDTALDRLRHRFATLPARAELEKQLATRATKAAARAEVATRRDALLADEKRLDDESRSVGAHADDVDKKLYSGSVTSPRELQALQTDVEMLRARRTELEDQELDIMERREPLDAEVAGFDEVLSALEAGTTALRAEIAASEAEITAEIAVEEAARAATAATVSDVLVKDYEKRRAQNKGAGAARLVGTTCQACHLTIPSTEAERIRKEAGSTVSYCDNCSAILVP